LAIARQDNIGRAAHARADAAFCALGGVVGGVGAFERLSQTAFFPNGPLGLLCLAGVEAKLRL